MSKPGLAPPLAVGSLVLPSMRRGEARRALYDAGWHFEGGGSFAAVYVSPDGTRAVRVSKPDPAAEIFAAWAETAGADDKHAPRIYGRIRLADNGTATEMEALEPADGEDAREVEDYIDGNWSTIPASLEGTLDAISTLLCADAAWDIHDGNIMYRGHTLVMTDPLYCRRLMHSPVRDRSDHHPAGDRAIRGALIAA